MYGIYANIWGILMVNVTIYSIHGSYGLRSFTYEHHGNEMMIPFMTFICSEPSFAKDMFEDAKVILYRLWAGLEGRFHHAINLMSQQFWASIFRYMEAGGFPNGDSPNGWFIVENHINMDDLGVPLILGNHHIIHIILIYN